ncbi:MAG TPA: hypothetical protein VGL48_02655 [Acidimicrobiales bacterium]
MVVVEVVESGRDVVDVVGTVLTALLTTTAGTATSAEPNGAAAEGGEAEFAPQSP